jgi:hypothetical protein
MGHALYEEMKKAQAVIDAYDPRLRAKLHHVKAGQEGKSLMRRETFQMVLYFLEAAKVYLGVANENAARYCFAAALGHVQSEGYMLPKPSAELDKPAPLMLEAPVRDLAVIEINSRKRTSRSIPVDPAQGCYVIPFPRSA